MLRLSTSQAIANHLHLGHQPMKREPKTALLQWQIRAARLPEPELEFAFHDTRRWRFDLAWPDLKFAVEIEGVVYPDRRSGDGHLRGRHASVKGFTADLEKYAEACCLGWRILRVLPKHVTNGEALNWIERVMDVEG